MDTTTASILAETAQQNDGSLLSTTLLPLLEGTRAASLFQSLFNLIEPARIILSYSDLFDDLYFVIANNLL